MAPIIIADSVTTLGPEARGGVLISGSHGGTYAAFLAARAGVGAAILNDAGVGLDGAGLAGLELLERIGIPGAAVSHLSARIGEAEDGRRHGIISHANHRALELGVEAGMRAKEALGLLGKGARAARHEPQWQGEHRTELPAEDPDLPAVVLLDSASGVEARDAGRIVVTGSHGGIVGGRRETALKVQALAAIFNDAGVGKDNAGLSRLPVLDERDIAAATVDAWTARIGDGRSTFEQGVISHLNRAGRRCGGEAGMSAREFVCAVHEMAKKGTRP